MSQKDDRSRNSTMTKQKKSNENDAVEQELSLLASIGSSVANMDNYERDVLRDAELMSTPRLSGVGLPDLSSLSPSGAPISDIPLARSVLSQIRSQIISLQENQDKAVLSTSSSRISSEVEDQLTKLYFKEQLLLSFVETHTGDVSVVNPQHEFRQEKRRQRRLAALSTTSSHSDEPITVKITPPAGNEQAGNNMAKKSSLKQNHPRPIDSTNGEGTETNQLGRKTLSAGERLETIKASTNSKKGVSFASILEEHRIEPKQQSSSIILTGSTRKRPRMSIMKHKQNQQQQNEEDPDVVERKKRLKKIREEREKRRRQRKHRWLDVKEKEDNIENGNDDEQQEVGDGVPENGLSGPGHAANADSEQVMPQDVQQPQDESDSGLLRSEDKNSSDLSNEVKVSDDTTTETSNSVLSPTFVTCPICSESIPVPASVDSQQPPQSADSILSSHIDVCQRRSQRIRGQRRSGRVRSTVKSYAEDFNDVEFDNSILQHEQRSDEGKPQPRDPQGTTVTENVNRELRQTSGEEDEMEDGVYVVGDDEIGDDEEDDELLEIDESANDDEMKVVSTRPKKRQKYARPSVSEAPPPALATDDMDELLYEDRVDDWIETGIQNMREMKEADKNETPPGEEIYEGGLVVPAWINNRLFPYQRTGLQWMWELHNQEAGGIIGDEMGLGKTVQICAFLGCMASSRKCKSILVISPATMLQHWLKELAKWAPGLRRVLVHQSGEVDGISRSVTLHLLQGLQRWLKKSRRNRLFEAIDEEDWETRDPSSFCGTGYVCVTTYENVRRSPDIWTGHEWSYVVLDEAQKIRNPDADVTLACKRLRTPHRLALSGTPIQNDLRELWSLFDFVFPGRLGTLPAFEQEFADPIKRGGYSNATPMQVQLAYRCALILRDLINPYLLRRLKKDIKEVDRMPNKTEQVLFCRLGERQRALYEAFLQSEQVKQVLRGSAQLLGAITMLRKICNHPDLVCPPDKESFDSFVSNGYLTTDYPMVSDTSEVDDDDSLSEEESLVQRSGKLEVLAKILPLWREQGHRVLIFCQWKKMLTIVQRFTELKGWKFGRLDGNTNVAARQRLVDKFNSDTSYFGMLCTTRTGGVGLNLTGASRIILYDPDWNPQVDAQARERAWRFGQERDVTIYRLIVAGTVEEKIYQRQIFKTALSNKILQDPKQRRLFSQRDLKDLFSLKEDSGSIISGGEGFTETSELTNGEGYVDPDDNISQDTSQDDGEALKTVLRSKGLAGVFDHQVVEKANGNKRSSIREMEARAQRIAKEALAAIEESVTGHDSFTPTWTGSKETETGRFGSGGVSVGNSNMLGQFGGVAPQAQSSGALLASLRERNEDIRSGGTSNRPANSTTEKYSKLLIEIRNFVRRKRPTTDAILEEFSSIPNCDAAIFRRLLNSVAAVEKGRWRLKKNKGVP